MDMLDREEELLAKAYENGELTLEEYNKELQDMRREYRWLAEEAAQEAYDNEMQRWE
jgi:hypothetical protein